MKGLCMKTRSAVLLTGLACLLAASVSSRAAVDVSFSAGIEINSPNDFYEPLTPYGEWVSVGSYGRCWHPINVERGWRPYCEGHWEWTDCGWYWVSDEPWSWACYHYGSWVDDPGYGWCWIPATEWAPAWVTWREAPDYIGWAPCGPGGAVLAPSLFVFVDVHRFHDRIRPNTVIVNNTTIINRTRVINDFRREDRDFGGRRERVVVNQGPRVEVVAKATGRTFTPRPIREVVRQTPVPERIKRTGTIERPVLREENVRNRGTNEQRQRERNTGENQRERQVSPTGRDQQRTYPQQEQQQKRDQQQPEQQRREQQQREQQQRREQVQPQRPGQATPERPLPPTGREQPRVSPQQPEQRTPTPQRPEQVRPERPSTPSVPDRREQVRPERPSQPTPERPLPPTGRDQPRVSPGQQPREIPQRPEQARPERPAPQVPPERVLPPTGREVPREQPRSEQPAVREQPKEVPQPQRPATPPGQDRGRGQDKRDKGPDGQ